MAKSNWHLQTWDTTWVVWGFGLRRPGFEKLSPAKIVVQAGEGTVDIPFELTSVVGQDQAQEYERVKQIAWRFKTHDLLNDTGWVLSESPEAVVEAARVWAQEYADGNDGEDIFLQAVEDVRPIPEVVNFVGMVVDST